MKQAPIAIIAASDSDLPVINDAAKVLKEFGVSFEITISSAHRSPKMTIDFVSNFHQNGGKVIITGASLAAHLAGAVAAYFPLPVIGIPLKGGALNGIDALYATVQMPPGVPVATVGIDNAKNAGLLAIQILATGDKDLEEKLVAYKKRQSGGVKDKADKLQKIGLEKYLSEKK